MSAEQAVILAESIPGLQAILIEGMHAVVGRECAEKAEARGVEFSWLYRHEGDGPCKGKIIGIPNGNDL